MILVLGNITLLIIGIILLIIGRRYEIKRADEYSNVYRHCNKTFFGCVLTISNGFFAILFILVALIAHTTFDQDHKRIELEEKEQQLYKNLAEKMISYLRVLKTLKILIPN